MSLEIIESFGTSRQRLEVGWDPGRHVARVAVGTIDPVLGLACELDASGMDRLIAVLRKARREAFGPPPPTAAVIEIIEPGRTTDDTTSGSVIVPTEIRINGHQVLTTGGGVTVHEIKQAPREMAQVTMTLLARRLTIAAEGDL